MAQKRNKTQFNLIDALIIVFILAVIAAAAYLLFGHPERSSGKGDTAITFEARISDVNQAAIPFIQEGMVVRDSVTGDEIGIIVSVRSENTRYYNGVTQGTDGKYVLNTGEYADRYDVYVTVAASTHANENGIYTVGGTRVLIGAPVHFKVKSFAALAYIVNTEIPE